MQKEQVNSQVSNSFTEKDGIERFLSHSAQFCLVAVFGLLPIFFIPSSIAPFEYSKVLWVTSGLLIATLLYSLSVLRSGKMAIAMPWFLYALWGFALVSLISSLFSANIRHSFFGTSIEVHTALFIFILATASTLPLLIGQNKKLLMQTYLLFTACAFLLATYHVLRLVFGASFLPMGVFTGLTDSPLGTWNNLGLFFGLIIILAMVAIEQLPLTRWGQIIFAIGATLSLVMLLVINFFAVWIVLGLTSLVLLMYSLTKHRFSTQTISLTPDSGRVSTVSVALSFAVFFVSVVAIVGGSALGGVISNFSGVSFVEVRPSFPATMDIVRNVYAENAVLGVGPNGFVSAWRLYKDQSINDTIFWASDFTGGYSFVLTAFANTGVLGALLWIIFIGLLLYAGVRMLFMTVHADATWYFIGCSSFVASLYLWGMTFLYIPNTTVLLLAAFFTSVFACAYSVLTPVKKLKFSVAQHKGATVLLVGVVMLVIIGSVSALYGLFKDYASVLIFNNATTALVTGDMSVDEVEDQIRRAYSVSEKDVYMRQLVEYQLLKLNSLLAVEEPSQVEQNRFAEAAGEGIRAGMLAVNRNPTDPLNWSYLGAVYAVLAGTGLEQAVGLANEMYTEAVRLNPKNPLYGLLKARLASQVGDLETARSRVNDAISLKGNYTDALFFLTQIDIAEGRVDDALRTTRSIVTMEPNNPARLYQLGILEASQGNNEAARQAFERAVLLDPNYANARYFLALSFIEIGNIDTALEHLRVVERLNPNNETITQLIQNLESGEVPNIATSDVVQIEERPSVVDDGGAITTSGPSDTPLISPVNIVPSEAENLTDVDSQMDEFQVNEGQVIETNDDEELEDDEIDG